MPMPSEEYTLTVPEAAAMLGGSEKAIQRLIFSAKLDAIRIRGKHGHEFRVRPEEIRARQAELHRFVAEVDAGDDPRRRAEARPQTVRPEKSDAPPGTPTQIRTKERPTPTGSPHGSPSSRPGSRPAECAGAPPPRRAQRGWALEPFLALERLAASETTPLDGIEPTPGPGAALSAAEEGGVLCPHFGATPSEAEGEGVPARSVGHRRGPCPGATEVDDTLDALVGAVSALVDGAEGERARPMAPKGDAADVPAQLAAFPALPDTGEPVDTATETALEPPTPTLRAGTRPLESLELEPENPSGLHPENSWELEPDDRAPADTVPTSATGPSCSIAPADVEPADAVTATSTPPISAPPAPEKRGLLDRLRRLAGLRRFRS